METKRAGVAVGVLALCALLVSCASSPESRDARLQIAIAGLQEELEAIEPFLDEDARAYTRPARAVLEVIANADGQVDWDDAFAAMKVGEEIARAALIRKGWEPLDAQVALSAVRAALRAVQAARRLAGNYDD